MLITKCYTSMLE